MMEIRILDNDFTVCKLQNISGAVLQGDFVFLAKTDDEVSLVCETAHAPKDAVAAEDGWKGLRIAGVLDFSMTGVIARIAGILAEAEISVFVVSTYDTDYILLKAPNLEKSAALLRHNGYTVY